MTQDRRCWALLLAGLSLLAAAVPFECSGRDQDQRHGVTHRCSRGLRKLRGPGSKDRRSVTECTRQNYRRASQTDHRGQKKQSEGGGSNRREAHCARSGHCLEGCLEVYLHIGGHAKAYGVRCADGDGDVFGGENHHLGHSLALPHKPNLGHGSSRGSFLPSWRACWLRSLRSKLSRSGRLRGHSGCIDLDGGNRGAPSSLHRGRLLDCLSPVDSLGGYRYSPPSNSIESHETLRPQMWGKNE